MRVHGLVARLVCYGGRNGMRILCVMAMGAALACGQTSIQVFSVTHAASPQEFQSIANAVKTIGAIEDIAVNVEAKSLSVTGTPDQIALADFVVHAFDIDPQQSHADTQQYVVPHASDDLVKVFYFNRLQPAQLQELVNMMRTIVDVTRIYQNLQVNAIAARGTSAQMAASAWMAAKMTQPPTAGKQEYDLPPSADYKGRMGTVVRIFFLTHNQSPQDLQEVINALRTITDASKIYQYRYSLAIVMRGQPERIAVAEWLVDKLDRPPATESSMAAFVASPVYPRDPPAVRVFYLPSATPQAIQEKLIAVRTKTEVTKVYGCSTPRVIALRGSDSQAAEAEALFR